MKYLLTACLSLSFYLSKADGTIITGNTTVAPESVQTYTVSWESWGSVYENYANVTWTVTGGTILASDKHQVTIQWNYVDDWYDHLIGSIEVYEDLGSQQASLSVTLLNFVLTASEFCGQIIGTPLVYVDFGQGNNPGAPLPTGATSYTYQTNCALFSDEYTIRNNTIGCRNQWYDVPEDHTPGDIDGYFLMIDGGVANQEVYRTTVNGLGGAYKYEFSAWIASLTVIGETTKIEFQVYDAAGTTLLAASGPVSVPFNTPFNWQRIGFMFVSQTPITTVQVVLVNRHGDPIGNDFIVDDISFAPCYPPILASFANGLALSKAYACQNGSINLYSWWPINSMFINPGFKWQRSTNNGITWTDIPGGTTMNYSHTENTPGIYQYRIYAYEISNPSQFVVSNAIIYYVQKLVVQAKTYDLFNCISTPVQLIPTYSLQNADPDNPPIYTFNWTPGTYLNNTQIESPTVSLPPQPPPNNDPYQPTPPGIQYLYTLTVSVANSVCPAASNTQTVIHHNPRTILIYTAFTPNGDGDNDLFRPLNIQDYPGSKFWVYDRAGQVAFFSQGPTLLDYSWNGGWQNQLSSPMPSGVYGWLIEVHGCPANIYNPNNNNLPFGAVTLIR